MNRKKHGLVALLVLLSLVVGLVGCGPAAKESTEINVLCTPQEEWCQGMKQEFEAKYGITVNYVRMSSGESLARLRAEKDNPQFDIWWGGPIDSFVAAKEEGLLEAYDSPNFKNLLRPDQVQGRRQLLGRHLCRHAWASAPTQTGWQPIPASRPPTSWDDLLKPEFKGQVMVAHPSTSGTSYTALATVLQIRGEDAGWEYLQQVRRPDAPVHQERRGPGQVRRPG